MEKLLRIAAAVPPVEAADPVKCCDAILQELEALQNSAADVIVLPALALLPPSSGTLGHYTPLLSLVQTQLRRICERTADCSGYVFLGAPVEFEGHVINVTAALQGGRILGFVLPPAESLCHPAPTAPFLSADTLFICGTGRIQVLACTAAELPRYGALAQQCDCLLLPSYAPAMAGGLTQIKTVARALSKGLGCGIVCVNGGVCDTSSPYSYRGYVLIAEDGQLPVEEVDDQAAICSIYDLDLQIVRSGNTGRVCFPKVSYRTEPTQKNHLHRTVSPTPYLPEPEEEYLHELFSLQAAALAARLRGAGIGRVVIGVSGGLDSTLALLVAAKALDDLHIPRSNLIAVTMPGFGTSDRTYYNAMNLSRQLGAASMDISIRAGVLQHFEDIGHAPDKRDITYENAQARERTQILLDLANKHHGIVVGTGDLTEAALGWCTFGGDALAGYNINIAIPKTIVRRLVALLAETGDDEELSHILWDILDTPISPELLPTDAAGEIAQKTEEILGDYLVHDFYLYHLVRYGFSPKKLLCYAQAAFGGQYGYEVLKTQLELFLRRFVLGQFKRSCAPDSAAITDWCLHGALFQMPSDMSPSALLQLLEADK